MKSTVRIDYDRNQELKPVIKIILPLDLRDGEKCTEGQDIDPRDKLVADFLHTPRNPVENYLFEVNQRLLINHGSSLLTTIAAIPEEEMFERFKLFIVGRIIGDTVDHLSELEHFRTAAKSGIAPVNYNKWLYINEFFEWLEKQPYHADEPIESAGLPKAVTMQHIFETVLSEEERFAAFNNTPKYKWNSHVEDAFQALDIAFDFATSPQGSDYWNGIIERLKKVPETMEHLSQKI